MYTVRVSVIELDEQGKADGGNESYVILMDRYAYDLGEAQSYADNAIAFVEESMAFDDLPYRPGCEPEIDEE
jgi:hypothetical protein